MEFVYVAYYADSKYEDMHPIGFYRTRATAYKALKRELERGYWEWWETYGFFAQRNRKKHEPRHQILKHEIEE